MNRKPKKSVFIILDGVGDRPLPILDGRTPLEHADTPCLDRLAAEGITGIADVIAPGVPVGTDVGHLSLFGMDPQRLYPGRGPLEALGTGFQMREGDIAFRCNFATVDDTGILVDRRAGRIRQGTAELAESLSGLDLLPGVEYFFRAATEHRAVLILRGDDLSAAVHPTDPGPNFQPAPVPPVVPRDPADMRAYRSAGALNLFLERARKILDSHPVNARRRQSGQPPANTLILRGGGSGFAPMPSLLRAPGFKGACVSGDATILGIARLAGLNPITQPGFTANVDTDLEGKAEAALAALDHADLVYIHIKAPDILGHDGKGPEKSRFIGKIDTMLSRLVAALQRAGDCYLAVAADHATPVYLGEHSGDPVPVLIWGPHVLTDTVAAFGERTCARGGLGRITIRDFLMILLDHLERVPRFEAPGERY